MRLPRSLTAGALTVAAAAALAVPGVAAAQGTSVKVGPSQLGRILVDAHGKTLYLWAHDPDAVFFYSFVQARALVI